MICPDKVFYQPGETVSIKIHRPFEATIWHLADKVMIIKGENSLTWTPPPDTQRGYNVQIVTEEGEFWTAFDILQHWTESPRYGFLFDFSPDNKTTHLDHLLAHHINGIQFYDWMYRHHQLLPPTPDYVDSLGRELSLSVVEEYIQIAHLHGMAAMPYTAIYAAAPDFANDHLEWGLYDAQHVLYDFAEGFLKIMNPASEWREHFIHECLSVLEALPFDGIHVDQYGEPQSGYNADTEAVDLPSALADTLDDLHTALPHGKTLLFNLVHNWPVDTIAQTPVDFLYCEIWPPKTRLRDLAAITQENWHKSGGRIPVIAVYINPGHEYTVKLVECVILASGGYHLVHGENGLYLSDPYFPSAGHPGPELRVFLKRVADFGVAYQELLGHAHPTTIDVKTSTNLWTIPRQTKQHLILNLVNTSPDKQWNQDIPAPAVQKDVVVQFSMEHPVKQVWYTTPDENTPPRFLGYSLDGDLLTIRVPRIETWTMVCVEFTVSESRPNS